jgi:RecA/RadA recombinase
LLLYLETGRGVFFYPERQRMINTIVVELYGGPGSGKSTLAAGLYYALKKQGKSVELCREYIKDWAYENRKIGRHDQIYLMGKQVRRESLLYGKVEYIITDSPILLSGFYEHHYQETDICTPACVKFLEHSEVVRFPFLLKRNKPYNPVGRYETEEQAKVIDVEMGAYLERHLKEFGVIDTENPEEVIGSVSSLIAYGDWINK